MNNEGRNILTIKTSFSIVISLMNQARMQWILQATWKAFYCVTQNQSTTS